jgi:hypothetical protein
LTPRSPRVEYVDIFKREIPLRKSPRERQERVKLQSENKPDIISGEFQKCQGTTLFILDGVGYSGGKLHAAKNQADTFSKARGMNVRTGILVVGLSVEETDNRYRPDLLTRRLQYRFDAVADRLLAGDGPQSTVDVEWGAILYRIQLEWIRAGLYVGSAKAPEDDWETYGKAIRKATTRVEINRRAVKFDTINWWALKFDFCAGDKKRSRGRGRAPARAVLEAPHVRSPDLFANQQGIRKEARVVPGVRRRRRGQPLHEGRIPGARLLEPQRRDGAAVLSARRPGARGAYVRYRHGAGVQRAAASL